MPHPLPRSLLCRRGRALPCSSRFKSSKEFLFNLVVVQYFFPSVPPTPSPVHAGALPPRHVGLGLPDHPGSRPHRLPQPRVTCSPLGRSGLRTEPWRRRLPLCPPCVSPHEVFIPGHRSLLSGLVGLLLRCVAVNPARADKACINFAAVWCINTLNINYCKCFL